MAEQQQTPISLIAACVALEDLWSPRVVGQVNDHFIKVARVAGEFPWHTHAVEDECFLVLQGTLLIGRSAGDGGLVEVHAGEFFVVPRGVRHNTSTPEGREALIALFEPTGTLHTGAEHTTLTRSIDEQLG